MAEINLLVAANRVLRLVHCDEVLRQIGASNDDESLLQSLEDAISTVLPLLFDVEMKTYKYCALPGDLGLNFLHWVRDFGEILDDAENSLESINFNAAVFQNLQQSRRKCADILCGSTSSTTSFGGNVVLPPELKKIKERLEELVGQRLGLIGNGELDEKTEKGIRVMDDLMITKELVSAESYFCYKGVGFHESFDEDKTDILNFLFGESENDVEALLISGGHDGMRPRAVARSVYNDEQVQTRFKLRFWVSLRENGQLRVIQGNITEEAYYVPLEDLKKFLRGKRFLVVVHDIDRSKDFSSISREWNGVHGSRVLMATCDWWLALNTSNDVQSFFIERAKSLNLFTRMAFGEGRETKEWHEDVTRKCEFLPIVPAMAIACTFYFEDTKEDCHDLIEKLIPVMSRERYMFFPRITPFLKLCYDCLPSNLKHCFAYCSLFPKGYEFDVQMLVRLWMAQGFISNDDDDCEDEDVGYNYFLNLLRRFFFYEAKVDAKGRVTSCKMHDLIHELSVSVAWDRCHLLTEEPFEEKAPRVSHFSFREGPHSRSHSLEKFVGYFSGDLVSGKKVRSILFPARKRGYNRVQVWDQVVSKFPSLRALDMHGLAISKLPDSIGELKHLRYLDLSRNGNFTELPSSTTSLFFLQTLRLSSCFSLKQLPEDIGKLVNLRHLEIDGCYKLAGLPRGFGQLNNLRTLSEVVLSNEANTAKNEVNELKQLHNLRVLRIKNLRHGMYDFLDGLVKLRSLSLEWEYRDPGPENNRMRLKTEQFKDIEELSLNGCRDLKYEFSETAFPISLKKLSLKRCMKCQVLPPLDQCVDLRVLVLDDMSELEYIMEEFSEKLCMSLQELWLTELPGLKGWSCKELRPATTTQEFPLFSQLCKLVIEDCPNFASIPLFPTLFEGLVLDSTSYKPFEQTMKLNSLSSTPLSKLKNMCIVAIDSFGNAKAEQITWESLRSLKMLKFDFLPKLDALPKGLLEVKTLRELHIWRCGVKELPCWIDKLEFLEKLVIRVCPGLKTLPEEIRNLKSLKSLEIEDCLTLLRRCEKEIGMDWCKIAHIPYIRLGRISSS